MNTCPRFRPPQNSPSQRLFPGKRHRGQRSKPSASPAHTSTGLRFGTVRAFFVRCTYTGPSSRSVKALSDLMAKLKPRGDLPHARVYHAMMDSAAWMALPQSAKVLWLDLRRELKSFNNGNISCALSLLRSRGWTSSTKLARAKFALVALGFLAQTRPGGFAMGRRLCSLYRFTDVECFDIPKLGITKQQATNDFSKYATISDAQAAMHAGIAELRSKAVSRWHRPRKIQVPNQHRSSAQTGLKQTAHKSRIETKGAETSPESTPVNPSEIRAPSVTNQRSRLFRAAAVVQTALSPNSGLLTSMLAIPWLLVALPEVL